MAQFASLASTDEWDIKDLTAPFFCFRGCLSGAEEARKSRANKTAADKIRYDCVTAA